MAYFPVLKPLPPARILRPPGCHLPPPAQAQLLQGWCQQLCCHRSQEKTRGSVYLSYCGFRSSLRCHYRGKWCCSPPSPPMVPRSPSSLLPLSYPHSPHSPHEDIGSMQKLITRVHSGICVKVRYSDSFIALLSLWFGKELDYCHLEMREYWDFHYAPMLFQNVLPQRLVGSLLCHILDIVYSSHVQVFASFSCIGTFNSSFSTNQAIDVVAQSSLSANSLLSRVAGETIHNTVLYCTVLYCTVLLIIACGTSYHSAIASRYCTLYCTCTVYDSLWY